MRRGVMVLTGLRWLGAGVSVLGLGLLVDILCGDSIEAWLRRHGVGAGDC